MDDEDDFNLEILVLEGEICLGLEFSPFPMGMGYFV